MIKVEIIEMISTRTHKIGDTFALKLSAPLKLGNTIVIPVGTLGSGEIIDAGKPGIGGKPGKLILAARSLTFEGQLIPLRGLRLSQSGEDKSGLVTALTFVPYVGFAGLLVSGGHVEIPTGSWGQARLSGDFSPIRKSEAP
ncbi:hypothetical protein PsB1_2299 [Candidatus Phycosocius spiralis]|uniref:Uncharacterized protein n=1 Tax=Candidatus Phycosocius spiralis TaxID=2815099 RepID=A0ABQ4PYI1_9PROT|nr:hypothetical protein PsB1_2299 [Candidatus Phycosocius spiralis]